ncbi:MAG TPA: LytR C-terminal domain-containing protein [Pedococcus sp.]|nr:LytR C-terminal domain-containing protein [Pedococcus sp.]
MSYTVETGASSAGRSRRRRSLITLALVALMLFFAFWYAYSYYRASGSPQASASTSTCTGTTTPVPSAITVNVYNATQREGLAARTAAEVRKRGFKVSSVANDPLQHTVTGVAEVRYGRAATESSKLVLALVKGGKLVLDGRTDGTVDLVLGEKFKALSPVVKAKPVAKPTARPTGTATTPARPAGRTTSPTPSRTC